MRWRSVFCTAFVVCCLMLVCPAVAAGSLQAPVPGVVTLGFGSVYVDGSRDVTHRGIDIAGTTGATVVASASGIVSFAGEVPADGGGRTRAVTVTLPDGLLVTVSPLAATSVRKGDRVESGSPVGELAPTGDASSESAHVHLSVRSSGVYVDPAAMLGGEASEAFAPVVVPVTGSGSHSAAGGASGCVSVGNTSHSVANAVAGAPVVANAVARATVDAGAVRASLARTIAGLRATRAAGHARSVAPGSLADVLSNAVPTGARLTAMDFRTISLVLGLGVLGAAVGVARRSQALGARAGSSE